MNEDDTFRKLKRTPFEIVLTEFNVERYKDVYSLRKLKSIVKKHHWDWVEFDICRGDKLYPINYER